MTKILALSGRKQSGKNTVANFVIGLTMIDLKLTGNFKILREGLWVSDILGDSENNSGIFDISINNEDMKVFLDQYLNPFIRLYSFADMLKKSVCMDILGLTHEQCYGPDEQKNTLTSVIRPDTGTEATAREVMQFVGTDFFRSIYPNVWVDATLRKIRSDNPEIAIVCDCRFLNEVQGVQNCGGKVVRLTRNGDCDDTHLSETALDKENFDWNKFDAVVDNEDIDIPRQNEKMYGVLRPWGFVPEITE